MEGYIALYRDLLQKPIWLNSTPEQKTILITLLLMVNHAEGSWEWGGQQFKTKPGQRVTSLESIAKACGKGISVKNVRTALDRFEKLGFLANQSTKTGRLITILNWALYQIDIPNTAKQRANTRQRGGKDLATNNNDKNENNENKLLFGEFVRLTKEQHKNLITDYGSSTISDYLDRLNNYLGSTGKRYKSHYHTILNWIRNDREVKQNASITGNGTKPEKTSQYAAIFDGKI